MYDLMSAPTVGTNSSAFRHCHSSCVAISLGSPLLQFMATALAMRKRLTSSRHSLLSEEPQSASASSYQSHLPHSWRPLICTPVSGRTPTASLIFAPNRCVPLLVEDIWFVSLP